MKYGPTVRIAPDELTTIDPNAWKEIYVAKPVLAKDPYSLTPPLNRAHSLFTAEGDTHRRLRGALVNGFADKSLRDQAPIVEDYADRLVARLRREANKSPIGEVDIHKRYGYAAFDSVTDLSFGESMHDTLSGDTDNDEITRFFLHAKFSTIRNCLSRFSPLDIFLGLFLLGTTRKNRVRNWQLTTSKIERRLARGDLTGVRSDLLTPLVGKINENGQQRTITKSELVTNQLAFVIAACQLTTVALSTGSYFLMRDRTKWERLAEEIRSTFASDEAIAVQSTQDLPYLNAVVNETMRIRHPTPISLPRCIPSDGRFLSGQLLPGNVSLIISSRFLSHMQALTNYFMQTIIGVNLQNIQTSPTLWVEPHEFHPERFLPQSDPLYEKRFDADIKSAFMPFSAGARNCIGNKYDLLLHQLSIAAVHD